MAICEQDEVLQTYYCPIGFFVTLKPTRVDTNVDGRQVSHYFDYDMLLEVFDASISKGHAFKNPANRHVPLNIRTREDIVVDTQAQETVAERVRELFGS